MNYWYFIWLGWISHCHEALHYQDENPLEKIRRNSRNNHKRNLRKQNS